MASTGTDDPQAWPPHTLAAVRERELAASLAVLGVTEHHWLGYADGVLSTAARDNAVDRIAGFIDDRPSRRRSSPSDPTG